MTPLMIESVMHLESHLNVNIICSRLTLITHHTFMFFDTHIFASLPESWHRGPAYDVRQCSLKLVDMSSSLAL